MSLASWIINKVGSPRLERKYYLSYPNQFWLESALKANPFGLKEIYAERQVNNIYLDDPDYTSFKENLVGSLDRLKLRLRWYGENINLPQTPNLEIKYKHGDLGYKLVTPLNNRRMSPPLRELVKRCRPVLFNNYLRRYFLSFDGKVRLTIDRELKFAPQSFRRLDTTNLQSSDKLVVELKYLPQDEKTARGLLQALPLQLTKNSKFVDGVVYGLA